MLTAAWCIRFILEMFIAAGCQGWKPILEAKPIEGVNPRKDSALAAGSTLQAEV